LRRRQKGRLLVAAISLAVAAGCGGGDGGSEPFSFKQARADVRHVIEQFTLKGIDGDGEAACSYATERYREEIVEETKDEGEIVIEGETCEEVIESAKPLVERAVSDPNLRIEEINVTPTKADAVTAIDTSFGPSRSRFLLVRVGEDWLIDHDVELKSPKPKAPDVGTSGPTNPK
jgi:hypothetical protein